MAASSVASTMPNACEHRLATACMLTSLPCCCSCADKRPQAAAYPVYVDGKGIRMQGQRWQRYCRRCRGKRLTFFHIIHCIVSASRWQTSDVLLHILMFSHIDYLADYWQSLASTGLRTPSIAEPPTAPGNPASGAGEMSPPFPLHHNGQHATSSHSPNGGEAPLARQNLSLARHPPYQPPNLAVGPPLPGRTRAPSEQVYPLGTREDVQQEDYVSPVASMFGRAYGRYIEAESARQAARMANPGGFVPFPPAYLEWRDNPLQDPSAAMIRGQVGMMQPPANMGVVVQLPQAPIHTRPAMTNTRGGPPELRPREQRGHTEPNSEPLRSQLNPEAFGFVPGSPPVVPISDTSPRRARTNFHRRFYTNPFETSIHRPQDGGLAIDDNSTNPIDTQLTRPDPVKSEDLKVDFACKVCTEQKINTVCVPCMHACMCKWCAMIHKNDCRERGSGRWNNSLWKCPICRKQIQEIKRFFI